MTSISKNMYLNKLDDIVNECNNTYNSTIKMKLTGVRSSTQMLSSVTKITNKNSKYSDYVRISKYKSIFAKAYAPNQTEGVFVVEKVKSNVPWTYAVGDLNGE